MWSNFQDHLSLSRIYRFLFCNWWDDTFSRMVQCALPRLTSDHSPILLQALRIRGGHGSFRFKELWSHSDDFMGVVQSKNVVGDSHSRIFALKLKALKFRLKNWSKAIFGAFDCFDSLEEDRSFYEEEKSRRENLRKEFQLMAIKEEIY